jgi:AcrR family transcriptional regulator
MNQVTRSDAQANRLRLIEAARAVFAQRGLDAEMKEVAERANLGIGTIYRNFATKDELVEAIIQSVIDEALLEIRAVCELADLRERITRIATIAWLHAERDGPLFSAIGALPPGGRREPPPELFQALVGTFAEGLNCGVVRPGFEPEFLARYLATHFAGYLDLRHVYSQEVVAANLTALFLAAVLAPP